MEFIKIINIDSVPEGSYEDFIHRKAVRAVVFDSEDKIALLHETVKNYYSLPGGAVEEGETPEEAIVRECAEEIGVKVRVANFLGVIREVKQYNSLVNDSYCYLGFKDSEVFHRTFTEESEENSEVVWVDSLEAKNLIQNSSISHNPKSVSSLIRDIEIINKVLVTKSNS
jgi:ADP-ribose pyrophosphatase YjhB (NUDIX family)